MADNNWNNNDNWNNNNWEDNNDWDNNNIWNNNENWDNDWDDNNNWDLDNDIISIERAIQIARDHVQGQVFKAELFPDEDMFIYEVIVLTPYEVYIVDINATTGVILDVQNIENIQM
ncbi:peptidase YpeB-like protein [Natranaerovirga pectinivora]|uniref:Peptidase YpeB-like protein n=1 Tax=Natranaerovirga pectinivora TaxID=682400 RepID=A0A4R3MPL7_9FIRM|nr:PepSY domain-containing protein [Natranaerovirga pectinivora]TCT17181.1 peptidase YpeB-like protein [Natranaerovirga pectinivora]